MLIGQAKDAPPRAPKRGVCTPPQCPPGRHESRPPPAMATATARFTRKQLEPCKLRNNLIIVIDNLVYDVTEFLDDHPGGMEVLLDNGGKDASKCFHDVGHSDIALEWRQKFLVGEVVDEDKWEVKRREPTPPEQAEPITLSGLISLWGPPVAFALVAALLYMYLFQ